MQSAACSSCQTSVRFRQKKDPKADSSSSSQMAGILWDGKLAKRVIRSGILISLLVISIIFKITLCSSRA